MCLRVSLESKQSLLWKVKKTLTEEGEKIKTKTMNKQFYVEFVQ